MRWEALFSDLQVQSAAHQQELFEAEVAEAVGVEWSRTMLCDRFRAHVGHQVTLQLRGGAAVTFSIGAVGRDWLSGSAGVQAWLIPAGAVLSVTGLSRRARQESSPSQRRLGIGAPLRALAAAREQVVVRGSMGELAEGVLVGVGADFLDIRSTGQAQRITTVPLHALSGVRSAAGLG